MPRQTKVSLSVIAFFALGLGQSAARNSIASGAEIRFTFGGTVDGVNCQFGQACPPPWDGVVVGDRWSLTYCFESNTPDSHPPATLGEYLAITSYTLTVGSATVSGSGDPVPGFIRVFSGQPAGVDQYEVAISLADNAGFWFMQLDDLTGASWSTDELPVCGDVNLNDFSIRDFSLDVEGFPGAGQIHGLVNTHDCRDDMSRPLPEDATHENIVPVKWRAKLEDWNLDTNQNYVDDEIDALPANDIVDVLLGLNAIPSADDLTRFSAAGVIGYKARYVPIVQLKGVRAADAVLLGADTRVALVEMDRPIFPNLDISTRAMRVRASPTYSPFTLDDSCPLTGAGVNIVIMDTGVDDGVHESLPAAKFVGGYDVFANNDTVNPNDWQGHGTHVAGIAMGTGGTSATFQGVAPDAGLIDMQVFSSSAGTTTAHIIMALDKCIEKRVPWNIRVVNMSLGDCTASNGVNSLCAAVNRVVHAGMVVVISVGNTGNCSLPLMSALVPSPGAADDAITVAAASYGGTVARSDDTVAPFSFRGPRLSDGDLDTEDECKPDVTAYGTNQPFGAGVASAQLNTFNGYVRLAGTSMAAPHVAGLAALMIEAMPGIRPLSCKQLILDSCEEMAVGCPPDWGNGLVDAFEACDQLQSSTATDLRFDVHCGTPGSMPYWWDSPDLLPGNPLINEGVANSVMARITNAGPNAINGFKVKIGIYDFSNSPTAVHHICTVDVAGLLLPGQSVWTPACPWTPFAPGGPSGTVHACLKAEIIYSRDTDFSNNCAQHNVLIHNTFSPAVFEMAVVNPTNEDLDVRLQHDLNICGADPLWTVILTEPTFTLQAGDPPRVVEVLVDPGANKNGAQIVNVEAIGRRFNGQELSLGGVTLVAQTPNIVDCNDNAVDDSMDLRIGVSVDANGNGIPDECETLPSGERLVDGCFPSGTTLHPYPRGPGNPWLPGEWNAESATIIGTVSGISPAEGNAMLRVNLVGGNASQVSQIIDVSGWAADIDAGVVYASASVQVNAAVATTAPSMFILAGGSQTEVGTLNPIGGPIVEGFNRTLRTLATDADIATWQPLHGSLLLPVGTRFLHCELLGTNATLPPQGLFFDCAGVELRRLLRGDMNCDGVLSVSDIAGFVLALTNPAGYAAQFPDCNINNADMNADGVVSVGDIGQFVEALTGR